MAKFEIYKDKGSEFRFRLKAGNGENILASEGYKSKDSCENGISSVQKNAASEGNFEKLESNSGKHYFNLKAGNGQVIGTSQMYASSGSRDNGIASVQKNAPGASVEDLT